MWPWRAKQSTPTVLRADWLVDTAPIRCKFTAVKQTVDLSFTQNNYAVTTCSHRLVKHQAARGRHVRHLTEQAAVISGNIFDTFSACGGRDSWRELHETEITRTPLRVFPSLPSYARGEGGRLSVGGYKRCVIHKPYLFVLLWAPSCL